MTRKIVADDEAKRRHSLSSIDALTAALHAVEVAINAHQLRVEASIYFPEDLKDPSEPPKPKSSTKKTKKRQGKESPPPPVVRHALTYYRGAGGWGLYVVSGTDLHQPEYITRLTDAPAWLRVRSVPLVEDLWLFLLEALQDECTAIQNAARKAQDFVNYLHSLHTKPEGERR